MTMKLSKPRSNPSGKILLEDFMRPLGIGINQPRSAKRREGAGINAVMERLTAGWNEVPQSPTAVTWFGIVKPMI
jgi:hypothetical protein